MYLRHIGKSPKGGYIAEVLAIYFVLHLKCFMRFNITTVDHMVCSVSVF